jgi:hypothetical protein
MSIDLNDNFLIHKIATKNYYEYGKLQKKLVIADMRHIFVLTFNPYLFYVKTRVNNELTMQTIPENEFLKTLKNIVVGIDDKSVVNLRTIFELRIGSNAVKNLFLVHDVSFYIQDPNVLSLFQGYPFEHRTSFSDLRSQPFDIQTFELRSQTFDYTFKVIQRFLDHVLSIFAITTWIYTLIFLIG